MLTFRLAQSGTASLRIYDIAGKQVATLFTGMVEKGDVHQVNFTAGNLAKGVYIAILQTTIDVMQKK